jgi:RHS repeat-associated protein
LNRLATAAASTHAQSPTHCWGQAFTYDNWGNLLQIGGLSSAYSGCTQTSLSIAVNAQNQIVGETYDTAGNLLTDPSFNTNSYVYNAENQMTQKDTNLSLYYDGDGKRVEKSDNVLYWYGADGSVLDVTNLQGVTTGTGASEYIYFGGRRIAKRDGPGDVYYYFGDHLQTLRSMAEVPQGQTTATLCFDADFYPFSGDPRLVVSVCQTPNFLFTGKEHDTEDNLDYFGARYYSAQMGRFMTPDTGNFKFKHLFDPQGLNRYAYTRNNPLTYVDADGKDWAQAWQDLRSFASSLYTKVTLGAGLYGKGKAGEGEVKIGIAYKNTIKLSAGDGGNASISLTQSVEASAEASLGGAKFGASKGAEQTVVAADTVGVTSRPGEDSWHSTETNVSRGAVDASVNSSEKERGIGAEEGAVLLGGFEAGTTAGGIAAWKDFVSNVHDEIIPPSPPPPPVPPPPANGPSNSGGSDTGGPSADDN